jgi:hypothetical protein
MKFLIGVDDTDNHESRGTGFRAREIGRLLQENGIVTLTGVTRHQLLFDRRIPYTSHNSSACIEVESSNEQDIINLAASYLQRESADGSDAGLCVAAEKSISEKIMEWGLRAKREIVTQEEARSIASAASVFLEGYTGTKGGIIGSLAGVGLRKNGNDGRFLHIRGMREINGIIRISELKRISGIQEVRSKEGVIPADSEEIFLEEWWRPVLRENKIVLFAEPANNEPYGWEIVSKDYIKSISS